MRKSELQLGRFKHKRDDLVNGEDLLISFSYGKWEFEMFLTSRSKGGMIHLYSWHRGEQAQPLPAVKLILWLKARQLGILEKRGFL